MHLEFMLHFCKQQLIFKEKIVVGFIITFKEIHNMKLVKRVFHKREQDLCLLINKKQLGFIRKKGCTTNLV
jgi:hypothetical protein